MSMYKMPPKKVATKRRQYTDAEKIAYYKRLANANARGHGSYVVSGHGSYKKRAAPRRRAAEPAAPSESPSGLGESIGQSLGGLVGRGAEALFKAVTGLGEYKVQRNTLMETNGPPTIKNNNHQFTIRHREYIKDIYAGNVSGGGAGSSPFKLEAFDINPGDPVTFPWLAPLAQNFEEWRADGIIFEFKSMYSDAVVTTGGSLGTVCCATAYNAANPVFTDKQHMENYEFGQSAKPSLTILHPIECKRSETVLNELYTRGAIVPPGQDQRMFDLGKFQIASVGVPVGTSGLGPQLGELWISYEITFMKPKLIDQFDSFAHYYAYGLPGNASVNTTYPLGSDPSNPAVVYSIDSDTTLELQVPFKPGPGSTISPGTAVGIPWTGIPQRYEIVITWNDAAADGTSNWQGPVISTSACTLVDIVPPRVFPQNGSAVKSKGMSVFALVDTVDPSLYPDCKSVDGKYYCLFIVNKLTCLVDTTSSSLQIDVMVNEVSIQ